MILEISWGRETLFFKISLACHCYITRSSKKAPWLKQNGTKNQIHMGWAVGFAFSVHQISIFCIKSKQPVPIFTGRPRQIRADAESRLSVMPWDAAWTMNLEAVSKVILLKGDTDSAMPPCLFIGRYPPEWVMKSAIKERWRMLTLTPYALKTLNTSFMMVALAASTP